MIITLLGGAGLMGAGIARDLLSDRAIVDFATLRICDAVRPRMEALAAELADPRVALVDLDAADPGALAAALEGADICINCVPTLLGHQMAIFEAALAARVPYLDLGGLGVYTVKQKAEHARFRDAGVTAVIGAGADPGMSNVICRAVADELDEIDAINLYWAAELVGDENPVLMPPYSISTVLAEYAHPSTQFYDGRHVECPPMSGVEVLELPEPWGRCEFMHSPHSEQLTVPLAAGIADKGIREFTWKLHLPHREHEAWVGLVKAGFGAYDDPVEIGGVKVKPLDVLSKVIERNIARNAERMPAQDSHEIHFAIGRGRRGGVEHVVRIEVVVTPDPLYQGYTDACTSMNGAIAAQLILKTPRRPGVWAPEEYFDIPSYFAELEKRHFRISKTVTPAA
ncbi:saccharopine dehydrogenase family protein [Ancylobacter lacus]|uniref:saccharopine dehydrogenase family protein n=1 Tax=Ancylobacter lacus TaxID=2579970 RepID=UPI001BCC9922|nr:saccharopine dehydrogenase NADP-binding domain-containing protein [Ancylobacter lacus]MBS7538014.1 saccharopine dehydrogenase NADP-binding domain-containing protein [Ancylobacter lacus]